jgi:charged multivesicular body protein 7
LAPLLPVPLSATDLTLLLTYLSRDNPHIALLPETSAHPTIIKLASSTALSSEPVHITAQDTDIATLKSLHTSLLTTVSPLEKSIAEHQASARKYAETKNASAARASLRRKALANAALDQRLKSIERVEEMLNKIDEAETNVAMVAAMEQASRVLKGINEKVGGTEAVEKVVDMWQDVAAEADEVDEILRSGNKVEIDEDEVDEEFEELVKEEKAKETQKMMQELEAFEAQKRAEAAKVEQQDVADVKHKVEATEKKVEEATKELAEMAI